jgi:neutral ceramidase
MHTSDLEIIQVGLSIYLVDSCLLFVLILTEFTTMAGRRLRDAVKTVLSGDKSLGSNVHVVIAGLTNTYSQYVTTYEEYEVQRYEVSHNFC